MSQPGSDATGHGGGSERPDRPGTPRNDAADDEVRERYRELLEEFRTILPGVQVLFAFLLTAPFSSRFTELDEFGRDLYGAALIGAALTVVTFLAPTSYHRIAPRRAREDRLHTAIRLAVLGMLLLAASIMVAVASVVRFVFGSGVAAVIVGALSGVLLLLWYVIPLYRRFRGESRLRD